MSQSFGLEEGNRAHLPLEMRWSQGDPLPKGPPGPPQIPCCPCSQLLTVALPRMPEPLSASRLADCAGGSLLFNPSQKWTRIHPQCN